MPAKRKSASEKAASSARPSKNAAVPFSLISTETFDRMYAAMLGYRAMQKRGRTFLDAGQEAVVVGTTSTCAPMTASPHRAAKCFSSPLEPLKNKRARTEQARQDARRNILAFAASSGAQLTIATGIALSNKDLATQRVVVAFGDADSGSLPAWTEALTLAGLHHLPVLFVLRYTGEDPDRAAILAAIEERARIAAVMAIPVDFADAVAIYRISFESLARARKGTGATLVIATPYIVDGVHAKEAHANDPIERMERYLKARNLFSPKRKAQILRELKK